MVKMAAARANHELGLLSEPVAEAIPDTEIISYVIPGRTGAQLLPEDLALLNRKFKNVNTVKEATGSLDNMRRTRSCCGPDFSIMSGDDGLTHEMMTDPTIKAAGAISVISNIAPAAVTEMTRLLMRGEKASGQKRFKSLAPLFDLVTVKTTEETPFGAVECRARNPLAIKVLMALLGMPAGQCRRPLGKLSKNGLEKVIQTARKVHSDSPEILSPVANFFGIDIDDRLNNPEYRKGLFYETY